MRTIALALVLALSLAACGGTSSQPAPSAPEIGTVYDVGGDNLSCYGTATMAISADTAICVWTCATVDGAAYRAVTVRFARSGGVWMESGRSRSADPGC